MTTTAAALAQDNTSDINQYGILLIHSLTVSMN